MPTRSSHYSFCAVLALCGALAVTTGTLRAQTPPAVPVPAIIPATPAVPPGPSSLDIHLEGAGAAVSPTLYGLMTEEINYSYDGGLYGEQIRNRSFQDDPILPVHWTAVQEGGAAAALALDTTQPVSPALPVSLKVTIGGTNGGRAGVANDGFWGIRMSPSTRYRASFYARAADEFAGPLTVSLESTDGKTVYARGQTLSISAKWTKVTVPLTTGKLTPTADTRFVISSGAPAGTVYLSLVSLFPPTYNNRPNGNRSDLMLKLAAMHPSFLRLPGGNYLEGDTIATRFDWKKTIGPIEARPGHQGPWRYRSSDGLGLLEFLEWCEDLHMKPVLAVYAGYSLKREFVAPGPELAPYVQDALDEIEYVTGAANTKWGAERIKDGHPSAFPLTYVEIGNEDNFDRSGSYPGRYAQFYDAIKAKYPALLLIATTKVSSRVPDVIDEHYYRSPERMAGDAHHYDNYSRTGPKIFVGEWASREGTPTPNMHAALGDAAWMTGMERNSDVVVMEAYAPLLVNVNPGGMQWKTDLIGYDAMSSYGSPAYWAQAMFSVNHGDRIVPFTLSEGSPLLASVTRDTKTGMVFVKVVNTTADSLAAHLSLTGAASVAGTGRAITLSSPGLADTNTILDPNKIMPIPLDFTGAGPRFDRTFAPYSVTVLRLQTK